MTPSPEPEPEHELVMPFVAVHSAGGVFNDLAYAAGWEMGALEAELRLDAPDTLTIPVRATNGAQAELVAMRHGYLTKVIPHDDYWSVLWLRRAPADLDLVADRGPRHGQRRRPRLGRPRS